MRLFENDVYRLTLAPNGRRIDLNDVLTLSLLAAVDTTDGVDETLAVSEPEVRDGTIVVERRSTLWERAWLELRCLDTCLEVHTCVRGRGDVTDVRLLGGRSLVPGAPLGLLPSGTRLLQLFSPNPEDLMGPVRDMREGAAIGVVGDGEPGRRRWLFTPAPLYVALGSEREWADLGLAAPVGELGFPELTVEAQSDAFSLRMDYEGHTRVRGEFRAPAVAITPNVSDPYAGLRRHRDDLAARGFAPPPAPRAHPGWWLAPIFCGWGAQSHLGHESGRPARDFARQDIYDEFLVHLEAQGVVPGIVVLDDKWQATYGRNEPDEEKWPDLKGWIAGRRARGQHVLLWWKAWDPDGVPPDLCVQNPDGVPVALDPSNPATRDFLRETVHGLLSPDDLDADGFKIDFTARTPSGRSLSHAGGAWGIALLHDLLAVVYAAAKEAKPDALVMTHTPHPSFADVTDMIRLNDIVSGDIVPQMRFRADVVRAACPELPIDTDDWRVHDKRSWRRFLEVKPEIGVPALYYASHIDATGEPLDEDDYAALRRVWAEWRAKKERVRRLDGARQGAEVPASPAPERGQ